MKTKLHRSFVALAWLALSTLNLQLSTAHAQGTAFTYQGQLSAGGNPANGSYDLLFTLYDASANGTALGSLTNAATAVSNGLFTATLDFGSVFAGSNYWLEIAVRTNGIAAQFSTLSPRQPITPTPYAVYSANAGSAATAGSANSVSAANIVGSLSPAQLPGSVVTNNQNGVTLAGTFTGNGAGLTNVNLTGLSAGSALGNLANGYHALAANTTGASDTANGVYALEKNTTGYNNTATGGDALSNNTSGYENTANGFNALENNTTGNYNTGNGDAALKYNTTGSFNSANGAYALDDNTTGNYNVANGDAALGSNTTGSYNTASGQAALLSNTTANNNAADGFQALYSNTTGGNNTASGCQALFNNTSGGNNIAAGYLAGHNITTGSYNIDIGNTGLATDANIIRIGSSQTQALIAGVITGDGSGLTNLNASQLSSGAIPLAQLPAAAVTNNQSGVSLNGTFTGNGAGLTGITASTLAIPPGMALIPAGAFTMGNSINDADIPDASPTNVTVSAFYMDVNLVSYSQWKSVYYWATNQGFGFANAGAGKAANHPVQTVDWYDVVKWCNARSQQAGKTPVYYTDAGMTQVYTSGELTPYVNWSATGYRLPTEAEWEKAARGGLSGQRFPWGNVIDQSLATYYGDTNDYSYDLGPNGYNAAFATGPNPYTSPVGSFAPNAYGLYDLAGNVNEWCWDWNGTPYAGGTDPRGPTSGSDRVLRGGVWDDRAEVCRAAHRSHGIPTVMYGDIGFRFVPPSAQPPSLSFQNAQSTKRTK